MVRYVIYLILLLTAPGVAFGAAGAAITYQVNGEY